MSLTSEAIDRSDDLDGAFPAGADRRPTCGRWLCPGLLAVAMVVWAFAVPLARNAEVGEFGLTPTYGGALLAVATAVALGSFVIAVLRGRVVFAAASIGAVIVIQRFTVTLITDVPIYSWTYKHIGLVDYILENNTLAPASVDIYNQWPGFFVAMAWFSRITDMGPVEIAHWFTPVAHLVIAVGVVALAKGLGLGMRAALTAAMLAELLNWVGQDYFAPQAAAVVLAICCLALLAHSKEQPLCGYLALAVFAAIVPSHQLTPVWLCAVSVALALFRLIRPLWLPLAFIAIELAYLLPRLQYVERYGVFTGFKLSNTESNVPTRGSDGRVFTMIVDRSISAAMWIVAIVCFVVLWRRVGAPWAAAIMAFSSMMLLGGQSYGGEAIFRVYLYSIPGCVALIAPFIVAGLTRGYARQLWRRSSAWGIWLLLVVVMLASMQGYFGGWSYTPIARAQLEQSRWLLAQDPAGATITVMAPAGWPERASADYVGHALADSSYDAPLVFLKRSLSIGFPTPADLDRLELIARSGGKPLYLVLPRQTGAYSDYFGLFRNGAVPELVEQLSLRPNWIKIIDDKDTVVFHFTEVAR